MEKTKKSVEMCVEFFDKKEKLVFAVLYAGYVLGEYLYLQKRSKAYDGEKDFLKVSVAETEISTGWSLWEPEEQRSIHVDADLGLNDPRLLELSDAADIAAVQEFIEERARRLRT